MTAPEITLEVDFREIRSVSNKKLTSGEGGSGYHPQRGGEENRGTWIFMIRQIMDQVTYRRVDGKNVLELTKNMDVQKYLLLT